MSWLLGLTALGFLGLLLGGKILTVLELRALEEEFRRNQHRIAELNEALDTSRRKYLLALKAEGTAKRKLVNLKTRFAHLKQHLEQIEATVAQQRAREQQELEHALEVLVMKALGGPSVRRDSHFKRVMGVIRDLIDLEKHGSSEELIAAVQEKLAEMGRAGTLRSGEGSQTDDEGGVADAPASEGDTAAQTASPASPDAEEGYALAHPAGPGTA